MPHDDKEPKKPENGGVQSMSQVAPAPSPSPSPSPTPTPRLYEDGPE